MQIADNSIEEMESLRSRVAELESTNAQLQSEVEESRHMARMVSDAGDFYACFLPDGRLTSVNAPGRALLGWPASEGVEGKKVLDVYPRWVWQMVKDEGMPSAIEQGVWRGKGAILDAGGNEVSVSQVVMAHRDAEGDVRFFSVLMRDLTSCRHTKEAVCRAHERLADANAVLEREINQRERTERVLQAALDLNQLASEVSPEDVINAALEEGVRITGSTIGYFHFVSSNQQAIILKTWSRDTVKDCSVPDLSKHYPLEKAGVWADCVRTGKPTMHNDYAHDPNRKGLPKGHISVHRHLGVPILEGGEVVAVIGVGNRLKPYTAMQVAQLHLLAENAWLIVQRRNAEVDLLERKNQLERQADHLERANTKLKEMDRLKSMFIASMSHELRSPLNSIIGFTRIVLKGMSGELNDTQRDQLGRAHSAANHLLNLISDIIDISKIEAGRVDANPVEFTLAGMVTDAVESIRPLAESKGLSLSVDVPSGVTLQTDQRRLFQCLINLLSNAVKYSESGTIAISGRQFGSEVAISVADTGIGIADDDLPRVFDAFERLDSHLRVSAGGVGLGLYITRKMIRDLLKGEVTASSERGVGSTFTITIPLDLGEVGDREERGCAV